jgi:multiple sugar transport system permease protein
MSGKRMLEDRSGQRRKASRTVLLVLLIVITTLYMIPLLYIANTAFRPWKDIKEYPPRLIFEPSLGSFVRIFTQRNVFPDATAEDIAKMNIFQRLVYQDTNEKIIRLGDLPFRYLNSIIICLMSTFITITLATFSSYGFSRHRMKGKDDLLFFILSTRMLPPVVVVTPIFLMFRFLHLTDTRLGLVLLNTCFNLSFAIWVLKGFIDEIPHEYEQAAMTDGYTRFEVFWKIVLPQARTGIAATAVFVFIFVWNEYAFAFLLSRERAQTVPAWLPYQLGILGYDWGASAAGSLLFLIPPMIFTIFLRKNLVRGITFGAIRK